MGFGGAVLALSAVQGIASIGQGFATNQQDKYNAQLYDQQAQAIQIQGNIQQGQLTTQGGQLMSKATATAGAAGLEPTGSVAATMLSAQTQVDTDKAIAQYNTTMGMNAATQQATQLRNQGNAAVYSGFSSAFSDMLQGTTKAALYSGLYGAGSGSGDSTTSLSTQVNAFGGGTAPYKGPSSIQLAGMQLS